MDFIYPSQPTKLTNINSDIVRKLSKSGEWYCEPKFNGCRCIIITDDFGTPVFWGRDGQILKACHYNFKLTPNSVYDSEWMMTRLKGDEFKNKFWIFDVYRQNGEMIDGYLDERKKLLETNESIKKIDILNLMPYSKGVDENQFGTMYHEYIERVELEGVVLKEINKRPLTHRCRQLDNINWIKIRQPDMMYKQKKQGC
jgi:ATP-dependent DNA ligase